MVYRSLAAAEMLAEEGLSVQVIDMRCLQPLNMDMLIESVKNTNRVLVVEEDNLTGGWGAEIAARLGAEVYYYLDAPIKRIAAPDPPAPTSAPLEEEYLPSTDKIVAAVQALLDGG